MSGKERDLEKLKALKSGETCTINWFEEGGGEVYKVLDVYVMFYVPHYGGKPYHDRTYLERDLQDLIDTAYSWT
jgi:hypothetical protein